MTSAAARPVRLAPLTPLDAPLVQPLAARAFDDLAVRQGRPPRASLPGVAEHYLGVHEHLLRTGSGIGAWDGDVLVGVAVSYRRAGTWVLALLVVEPGHQSLRAGSTLLAAALEEAAGADVRLLHSSQDSRAMRTYSRAGFRLLPALRASGRVQLAGAPEVVDGRPDAAGSALSDDVRQAVALGGRALALADGREGLALLTGPPGATQVLVLAAADRHTAQDLLRGTLAATGDAPVELGPLAPQEDWALEVALEARLDLAPSGPVAVAGLADPLAGLAPPPAVFI